MTPEDFDTKLKSVDETSRNMFEASQAAYTAERMLDSNWWLKASNHATKTLVDQLQEAWDISQERNILGTISDESKALLADCIAELQPFLFGRSQRNWFLMKNNSQGLINMGLQEAAAGIRRVLSGQDWQERCIKFDKEDQLDAAISQIETGRDQKINGIIQVLAVQSIFDGLVNDEFSYPVNYSAVRAANEALRFEAYQHIKKFAHPGMTDKQTTAATTANDFLAKEAIGGI